MNPQKIESALGDLFESWAGEYPDLILPLAPSGSDRVYYRLQSKERVAIGTYSPNDRESRAFLEFSRHFFQKGLPVPEIYAENLGAKIYLQEDLGSTTLYSFLIQQNDYFPDYLIQIFKRSSNSSPGSKSWAAMGWTMLRIATPRLPSTRSLCF